MKTSESEYRVREVKRYIVTHWYFTDHGDGRNEGGCNSFGEFDNVSDANTVASALQARDTDAKLFLLATKSDIRKIK